MARYELAKPDFELLDEALQTAARLRETQHRLGCKLTGFAYQYRDLAERFRAAHTAWIEDENG